MVRRRLDAELVRRELAPNREQARTWIEERQVTVNGSFATKPAAMVAAGDAVEVLAPPPQFVGRGGDKLTGALEQFGVDPAGLSCIDVGSSTGGFTDAMLQRGARHVVAVDVGRAQLHDRLRRDERVTVAEQTDIRAVEPGRFAPHDPFDLVVIDVSFIGLDAILDAVVALMAPDAQIVSLVKPQFEAGRAEADKGKGIIRDPDVWSHVLHTVVVDAQRRGLRIAGVGVSPIRGGSQRGKGNVEFFLHAARPEANRRELDDIAAAIDAALVVAGELG